MKAIKKPVDSIYPEVKFYGWMSQDFILHALSELSAKPNGFQMQLCPFADKTRDSLISGGLAKIVQLRVVITEAGLQELQ
jgi:hypothetical protein